MSVTTELPRPAPPASSIAIDRRLQSTRRQLKYLDLGAILLVLLAGNLLALLTIAVVEHWLLPLSNRARWLVFSVWVGGNLWFLYRHFATFLFKSINPLYAAQLIERGQPALKNSLLNFLYLRGEPERVSEHVLDALGHRAAVDLEQKAREDSIDFSKLIYLGYGLAGIIGLIGAYKVLSPKDPFRSAFRAVAPWMNVAPAARVRISHVKPGDIEIYQGESLNFSCEVLGLRDGENVSVVYTTRDQQVIDRAVPMSTSAGLSYSIRLPDQDREGRGFQQEISYRIVAGDATSTTHRVRVNPAPIIEVARLKYEFPAYTKRPPVTLEGKGDVKAVEGTLVTVDAKTNIPAEEATLTLYADGSQEEAASERRILSQQDMTPHEHGASVSWRLERAERAKDRQSSFDMRYRTKTGAPSQVSSRRTIDILPDLAPEITVIRPTQGRIELPINQSLDVEARVIDPDFGLSRVRLIATRAGREIETDVWHNVPQGTQGPVVLRKPFTPKKELFSPGDEVLLQLEAQDNRTKSDGSPHPNTTVKDLVTLVLRDPVARDPRADQAEKNRGDRERASRDVADESRDPASANPDQKPTSKTSEKDEPKKKPDGSEKDKSRKENANSKEKSGKDKSKEKGKEKSPDKNKTAGKDDRNQDRDANREKGDEPKDQQDRGESGKEATKDPKDSGDNANSEQKEKQKSQKSSGKDKSSPGGQNSDESSEENAKEKQKKGNEKGGGGKGASKSENDDPSNDKSGESNEGEGDGDSSSDSKSGGSNPSKASGSKLNGAGEQSTDPSGDENGTGGESPDGASGERARKHDGEVFDEALRYLKEQESGKSQNNGTKQPSSNQRNQQTPASGDPSGSQGESGSDPQNNQGGMKQGDASKSNANSGSQSGNPSPNGEKGNGNESKELQDQQGDEGSENASGKTGREKGGNDATKNGSEKGENAGKTGQAEKNGDTEYGEPSHDGREPKGAERGSKGKSDPNSKENDPAKADSRNGNDKRNSGARKGEDSGSAEDKNGNAAGKKNSDKAGESSDQNFGQAGEKSAKNNEKSPGKMRSEANDKEPVGGPDQPKEQPESQGSGSGGETPEQLANPDRKIDQETAKNKTPSETGPQDGRPKLNNNDRKGHDEDSPGMNTSKGKKNVADNNEGADSGEQSGAGSKGNGQSSQKQGQGGGGQQTPSDKGKGVAPEAGNGTQSNDPRGQAGSQASKEKTGATDPNRAGNSGQSGEKQGNSQNPSGANSASKQGNPSGVGDQQAGGNQMQSGGTPTGGERGAPSEEGGAGSVPETNVDDQGYAKKATDLVLDKLKDQASNPDPELLKRLGLSKEELNAFVKRWESMKKSAREDSESAQQLDDAYRNLGLRPAASKRRAAGTQNDQQRDLQESGSRSQAPAKIRDRFNSFLKGVNRRTGDEPATK